MKVLHLCDHYRPFGGAEKLLFDTLFYLENDLGVENVIVTENYPENHLIGERKEYIIPGIAAQPTGGIIDYLGRCFTARKHLRRVLEKEKPDVVHIHNLQNPFSIAEVLKASPCVRSIHDPRLYCFNNWRLLPKTREICPYPLGYKCLTEGCLLPNLLTFSNDGRNAIPRYLSYRLHRKMDKIIGLSQAMISCILQNGYREEQIAYLPNFTATYDLKNVLERNIRLARPNENSIVFAGRASHEKGIDYLLEAAALLKVPFRLYLVTDGPYMSRVYAKIKILKLENKVELVGALSYEKTRDYYSMADVVVVPSVWIEPFCLVGIEAMANAKPVVAYRTGGIPDWLVDGKTGLLAECKNVIDLAEKIENILLDKEKGISYGLAGFKRVQEKYNKDIYLTNLLKIYASAIDAGKIRLRNKQTVK
ncbi:MAG: glycosyltransferase family 4 protein [Candidatus Omnitrophica bacterium]|nr:glycosyltransferase family 4 protein [Candidatus Omnitrophota bacterium]